MPDKTYVTTIGFVQFDPNVRDVNGKNVTDVTVKTPGGDGKLVRITVWPEFKLDKPIERGDLVAADGTFSSSTYQAQDGSQRTSLQISAFSLNVNGKRIERAEREVVTPADAGQTEIPF